MNKIYIIIIVLSMLFFVACSNNMENHMMNEEHEKVIEGNANDEMMREHCQMMPQMVGCESYLEEENEMMMGSSKGNFFDRSIMNLKSVEETQVFNLDNQDRINLSIDIIKKEIAGKEIRMFGYNGQIPGPLLHVKQDSIIYVNVTNNLDIDTTVHWHGLRLDNKFDGVPGVTMNTQFPGESFEYRLDFVDEGIYWYHPHVRDDYGQELGLYGNILVDSKYKDYYNNVNKEIPLIIDDILIENGDIAPFFDGAITHSLMGRFGNIMLTNGDDNYELEVNKGEVVRFYITNVANSRTFNFSIPNVKMKLVGGDVGSYEKEEFFDSIIIAPAERYTIETYFEDEGEFKIKNINLHKEYILGKIRVLDEETQEDYSNEFVSLRENKYVKEDISNFREFFDKELDYEITLSIEMKGMGDMGGMDHNVQEEHISGGGIEWEDEMPMMSSMTNDSIMWILRDKDTGAENMDIDMDLKVGEKVKIRLFNDPNSMHPMQHPIHFHGQRFLVLEKDGEINENLVWKDTVLVPIGSYVDILLDVTNPGEWMAHCHISEHLHSGMMMSFEVAN